MPEQLGMGDSLRLDHLPASLAEIAACIGLQPTLRLVERWGGLDLWVPQRPSDELLAQLGREAAEALCARYGLERVYIARAEAAVRAARDAEIRDRRAAGWTAAQLARRYGLTERRVWAILASSQIPSVHPQHQLL